MITIAPSDGLPLYYVGQSQDFAYRRRQHMKLLRGGRHHNVHLQRAFLKHGADHLKFELLEGCAPEHLDEHEQWWLDLMCGHNRVMNFAKDAASPNRGRVASSELREKLSRIRTGKKMPPFSAEHRAKIGAARSNQRGRKATDEHRRKIGDAQRGPLNHMHGKVGAAHHGSKAIVGTHEETGAVLTFSSGRLAEDRGFNSTCISQCCTGKRKRHMGYVWQYVTKDEPDTCA